MAPASKVQFVDCMRQALNFATGWPCLGYLLCRSLGSPTSSQLLLTAFLNGESQRGWVNDYKPRFVDTVLHLLEHV